jgi:antirestriction protein ArdC
MEKEQAKKAIDEAVEQLAAALERGKSDDLMAYLAAASRFHKYSFSNILLILKQRPEATRVAGFRTWKALHRHVKRGEKGILIVAPMICRARADNSNNRSLVATQTNGDAETFLRFKAAHVFDVAQTDGEALPEPATFGGNPGGFTERLKDFVASSRITLEYSDSLGNTLGASQCGTIKLRVGLSPAEEFSTLVHELAHELLHPKNERRDIPKHVKETEAEAVAFVVSHAIGLEPGTAASDYIQLYSGSKKTLVDSLDRIQKTSASILNGIADSS